MILIIYLSNRKKIYLLLLLINNMARLFSSKSLLMITAGLIYLAWPFLGLQASTDLSGRILLQVESKGEA